MDKLGQTNRWPQVCKEAKVLSKWQEGGALGLFGGRKRFPFGPPTDPKGWRPPPHTPAAFLQAAPSFRVDRRAADRLFVEVENEENFFSTARRTCSAAAMTSGPIPSPASTAIL